MSCFKKPPTVNAKANHVNLPVHYYIQGIRERCAGKLAIYCLVSQETMPNS